MSLEVKFQGQNKAFTWAGLYLPKHWILLHFPKCMFKVITSMCFSSYIFLISIDWVSWSLPLHKCKSPEIMEYRIPQMFTSSAQVVSSSLHDNACWCAYLNFLKCRIYVKVLCPCPAMLSIMCQNGIINFSTFILMDPRVHGPMILHKGSSN